MRVLGTVAALVGLAIVGALVGYALGTLCSSAWVWMLKTRSFEGYSGMLMSFGLAPAGAFIGGLALPGLYLVRLARRGSVPTNGDLPRARRRRSF